LTVRIFVTGASGFIGSAVVAELRDAGHRVVGLARSAQSAAAIAAAGAQVHRGSVEDLGSLRAGATAADGVIHCAFGHDFSRYVEAGEADSRAVSAMAEALAGTGRPLVVTSGTGVSAVARISTEADAAQTDGLPGVRGRPEETALSASRANVRSVVVRLPPSVHDVQRQGMVSALIAVARQTGVSAFVGEGANRWPAVHRRDAARLFRLALEHGHAGERLHGVAEEGVTLRSIAEAIGSKLGIPTRSIGADEAPSHFGWLAPFASLDVPASSAVTRRSVGWHPTEADLLRGLQGSYLVA